MNLQLLITEKEIRHYNTETKTKHLFAVIDLDKARKYPQNFVSMLPKRIKATEKPANVFEGLFGNESIKIARHLLEEALETRPSPKTTLAIRERLKLLDPKLNNKNKCQNCGTPISQSKHRYRPYKFCYNCYRKGCAKQ
jgi:RNA polymerase-binding transcription factor DksA